MSSSNNWPGSPDSLRSPRLSGQGAFPFPRQDSQQRQYAFDRRASVRRDSSASVSSIGGSLDIRPLRTDNSAKDSSQNAISNLLQAPIVRTGLLPQSASAAPGYKAPSTRDIPPVTLTNIPHVEAAAFKDYLTRVTPLYESISRRREEAAKAEAVDDNASNPSAPSTPVLERSKRPSFTSIASSSFLGPITGGSPQRRRRANETAPLSTVPTVYFEEDFHLENPRTFDVVSERADVVRPIPGANGEEQHANGKALPPRKALATNAILQEKLSWYMDTVEVHLITSISTASTSFFAALGSLRDLQKEAEESAARIQKLRNDLIELDKGMALGGLEISRMRQRRKNIGRLWKATQQVQLIIDKVVRCEELVDEGEYEAAADGIDTTNRLISGQPDSSPGEKKNDSTADLLDLRELKVFQGLAVGMVEIQGRIGRGFQNRFTATLIQDLRSHADAVPANNTIRRWATSSQRRGEARLFQGAPRYLEIGKPFREALSADLNGLDRVGSTTQAADAYRDAVSKEIKALIRKYLPSSSDEDAESITSNATRGGRSGNQQEKSAILARNLRALDEQDAEALLTGICTSVSEVLRRLGMHVKVLLDITSSSEGHRSKAASPELTTSPVLPSATSIDGHLTTPSGLSSPIPRRPSMSPQTKPKDDLIQALDMSSLLGQAVIIAQTQITRILKVRAEQTHKLPLERFVRYFTILRLFADECEAISGNAGQQMKDVLNTQLAASVGHMAESESQKIAQRLESDTWDAQDFKDQDQALLSRLLDGMNSDPQVWTKGSRVWEDCSNDATTQQASANGQAKEAKSAKTQVRPAQIDETRFILVQSAMALLPILDEFLTVIASIPNVSTSAVPALMEVLRTFNSRSSQLILGAGATRVSGLKNITTKHLALSSQALSFVVALMPYLREAVRRHVGGRTEILAEFDKTKRLFQDHQMGIHDKLVDIMAARARAHLSAMNKIDFDKDKLQGPSPYMDTLTKETGTLYRVLARHLQEGDVLGIMFQIAKNYREIWVKAFSEVKVATQEGRARLLRDVELFDSRLSKIEGFADIAKTLLDNVMARSIATEKEKTPPKETKNAKVEPKESDTLFENTGSPPPEEEPAVEPTPQPAEPAKAAEPALTATEAKTEEVPSAEAKTEEVPSTEAPTQDPAVQTETPSDVGKEAISDTAAGEPSKEGGEVPDIRSEKEGPPQQDGLVQEDANNTGGAKEEKPSEESKTEDVVVSSAPEEVDSKLREAQNNVANSALINNMTGNRMLHVVTLYKPPSLIAAPNPGRQAPHSKASFAHVPTATPTAMRLFHPLGVAKHPLRHSQHSLSRLSRRNATTTTKPSALARLQSRLPPRLRPYLDPLLSAPVSHITAFLLLHEVTALVPLAVIFGGLHYSDSAPRWLSTVQSSEAFAEGVKRWGRYARRKGWVKDEEGAQMGAGAEVERAQAGEAPRVVLELAVAWAATKVLLPVRIVASVWATPWFARVAVVPVGNLFRRMARRG